MVCNDRHCNALALPSGFGEAVYVWLRSNGCSAEPTVILSEVLQLNSGGAK